MCYIRYQICNAQIKARVKYKVLFEYDMLKNTKNDKNILSKCLRKCLFVAVKYTF